MVIKRLDGSSPTKQAPPTTDAVPQHGSTGPTTTPKPPDQLHLGPEPKTAPDANAIPTLPIAGLSQPSLAVSLRQPPLVPQTPLVGPLLTEPSLHCEKT